MSWMQSIGRHGHQVRSFLALTIVALVVAVAPVTASAAGLLLAEGQFGGELEIKEHDVRVTINNGVAVTEVEQIFVNRENRVVEALYTFPVPREASVANFSMWINGKEMIGEVVEKKRAREIYESYKAKRIDPGLLEQVDYKRFEMRIFPIAARGEQRVKVTYYQELDFDHDQATYVYPLATTVSESGAAPSAVNSRTSGKFALAINVKSEVPLVGLSSPSHGDEFVTLEHTPHYYQASLETSGGNLNRDVVLHFDTERPRTGFDVITSKQNGEDGYFQVTLTAGKELEELSRGMDYVFILDISGSMANDGKMRLSTNSLNAFVESLGEQDRFEMMAFNVSPQPLWSSLKSVSDEAQKQAADFLAQQKARGGTSLRPAVESAYRYDDPDRVLNIVILSDGMTGEAEQRQLLQLIGKRPPGARVFCVGVGNEVNRPLLAQLAEQAGGLSAFVSQGDNFQRTATAFRRKLMRPAATNVTFRFDGVEVYDLEPEKLPNLYHGAPLRLYGRYKQSGAGKITFSGEVLGQSIEQTVKLKLPAENTANPEIDRMWAYHRVEQLMREGRQGGQFDTNEIVRLCEEYSIISEYASFIVLENDGEYRRWKIERRNLNRIRRDRAARDQLDRNLAQLRERSMRRIGPNQSPGDQSSDNQEVVDQFVNAAPTVSDSATAGGSPSTTPNESRASNPDRGFDIQFRGAGGGGGGGRGGGAIDPISGAIAISLAAAAAATGRRRKKRQGGEEVGQGR